MAKLSSTNIYGDLHVDGSITGTLDGNSTTATTLETARTINGTSFNGSSNITTANWGTARTLTIGNKGQSVNGSKNISWSLSDIGALPVAGGTATGDITISKSGARITATNGTNSIWMGINTSGDKMGLYDATDGIYLVSKNLSDDTVTLNGNADTTTKLKTARNISLTGDATGSASFDGSANASIAVTRRRCVVGQTSSTSTNPYYKFASIQLTKDHEDREIAFKVSTGYSSNSASGILRAHIRSSGTALTNTEFYWEYADEGIDVSKFVLAYNKPTAYPITVELWVKIDGSYMHYHFDVLQEHDRGNVVTRWTLYNTCAAGSASAITSGYTQVASTCLTLKNAIAGNAATATQFSANKSVTLTGDVTGTASSKAGWSVATTLANSGVTAGNYGPSANASPAHSGTFSIPYITVDAKGRVTAASTKTITLPADSNTDTKVTYTLGTTTKFYMGGPTATATGTGGITFDTGIYATTTAGQLQVNGGLISGSAVRSDTAVTDNLGASTVPWKNAYSQHYYINNDATGTNYGRFFVHTAGTTSAVGNGRITLGNSVASGTVNNAQGSICLYGSNTGYTIINPGYNSTSSVTLTLPSATGTIATTANIDTKVANYLPLAGGTMSGNITFNNNVGVLGKLKNATTDSSGAAVAAGTAVQIIHLNSSDNLHIGAGIYDKGITTGGTYVSGGASTTIRTVSGAVHIKPNNASVASFTTDSIDFAKNLYAKVGVKSGGNVVSDTAITDTLGTAAIPWKNAYSDSFDIYGEASKSYGYLRAYTTGTADTVGVSRLSLGNGTASGNASNAKGQIIMYGTNTGYTNITPGYNSTSNITVTLPSATGTVPLMSKGDTSYWGMLGPDGSTSWIRTTSSGLIPVDQNGTSALGTSSWPFGNIYGTTIYEGGTALSSKYAPKSHTHSYLPLSGGTMTGAIKNATLTSTWVAACKSGSFINSTKSAGDFSPMLSAATTNGRMTLAFYQTGIQCCYVTKANCDANNNNGSAYATLFDEDGNANWPGTVKFKNFEGTGYGFMNGYLGISDSSNTWVNYAHEESDHVKNVVGRNTKNGRFIVMTGCGNGSAVAITSGHSTGYTYLQYLSPESGTIALTSHLSDRTKKDNIAYIGTEGCEFTNKDFYNFIRDDLGLATYTLKKDYAGTDTHTKLNFIAQDILWDFDKNEEHKVGNLIVQAEDAMEEQLSLKYDPDNYISVIAGALKESINKIEELESENTKLKAEMDELKADMVELKAIVKGLL